MVKKSRPSRFFEKALERRKREVRAVYISTYIPRKCGIATYTKDLTNAINILNPKYLAEIMAVDNPLEVVDYPWEVKFRIHRDQLEDYLVAARYLNKSSTQIVSLQHEYGLFGGKWGDYILTLAERLKKPLVTTFHTVLSRPPPRAREVLTELGQLSSAVVVMGEEARKRIIEIYRIPKEKVVFIPHGVPDLTYGPTDYMKKALRLGEGLILTSSNLISPSKGLEYVIKAMPRILQKIPTARYFILGATHPLYKAHRGEDYRRKLENLVIKLKLEKKVIFVNRYLSLRDLVNFLKATDIFLTPYLDPNQVTSGSLAYAVGAGKVCISTPYLYAKELLAEGRGILVPFRNSEAIVEAVLAVANDKKKRKRIEKKAYAFGRQMIWANVALRHLDLFSLVLNRNKNNGNNGES